MLPKIAQTYEMEVGLEPRRPAPESVLSGVTQ